MLEKAGFTRVWHGRLDSPDPSDDGPEYVYSARPHPIGLWRGNSRPVRGCDGGKRRVCGVLRLAPLPPMPPKVSLSSPAWTPESIRCGCSACSAGDAKILRNAGARVTDDVLRTLVLARYLLGVDRVMIVAHTNCRMAGGPRPPSMPRSTTAGGPDTREHLLLDHRRPGRRAARPTCNESGPGRIWSTSRSAASSTTSTPASSSRSAECPASSAYAHPLRRGRRLWHATPLQDPQTSAGGTRRALTDLRDNALGVLVVVLVSLTTSTFHVLSRHGV